MRGLLFFPLRYRILSVAGIENDLGEYLSVWHVIGSFPFDEESASVYFRRLYRLEDISGYSLIEFNKDQRSLNKDHLWL